MLRTISCLSLCVCFATAVCMMHPAFAADTLAFLVITDTDEILVEGEDAFPESWANLSCIKIGSDGIHLDGKNWQLVMKPANIETQCPFPFVPRGDFLSAVFDDGSWVVFRFPKGRCDSLSLAYAKYKGKEYKLRKTSQLEVARVLTDGRKLDKDFIPKYEPITDTLVALADCKAIIAFHDNDGQAQSLQYSTWVLTHMLENYRTSQLEYPAAPSQLYIGEKAIFSGLPLNPYEIDRNLCESILSQPRPGGYAQYIPEVISNADGSEKVVGYWLAVIAEGEPVEPIKPLPEGKERPIRAVHWYEVHE